MEVLKPALFAAFVCGVFRRVGSPLDMFSVGKAAFLLRGSVYVLMGGPVMLFAEHLAIFGSSFPLVLGLLPAFRPKHLVQQGKTTRPSHVRVPTRAGSLRLEDVPRGSTARVDLLGVRSRAAGLRFHRAGAQGS